MNDNTKSTVVETVASKLPSLKTIGIFAGVTATVVATLALGCVAAAVQSDVGHEIIDLF